MAKKVRKPVVQYLITSGIILAVSLMFSVIGMIFLATPWGLQLAMGFVFMAPVLFLTYSQGRSQGERLYKKCAETSLTDLHNGKGFTIPYYKCAFHLIAYVAPLLILTILCVALNNSVIHFIVALFLMPIMLIFTSTGVILVTALKWYVVFIYLAYMLLVCGAFVFGFVRRIKIMKKQQRDIEGELRMFNN